MTQDLGLYSIVLFVFGSIAEINPHHTIHAGDRFLQSQSCDADVPLLVFPTKQES